MAEAVVGKSASPELVKAMSTAITTALEKVPVTDRLDGKLSLHIDDFDTLLGKVDKPKLELVESTGAKKPKETRGETLGKIDVPKGKELDDLQAVSLELAPKAEPKEKPTKEEFNAKMTGITEKGDSLFDKLDGPSRKRVFDALPTTEAGKKELKDLLHFAKLKTISTTPDQRLEIRALMLVAHSLGMSKEELTAVKTRLRDGSAEDTQALLKAVKDPQSLIPKFDGAQKAVKTDELPRVDIEPAKTVTVSPSTMQNLKVAQQVNLAVKSLLTEGAPNQAPDLYRTSGENILLHTFANLISKNLVDDPRVKALKGKCEALDKQRTDNGAKFGVGEDLSGFLNKAQSATVLGTGKCAEHAAVTMSLLTDPKSLAQLGVKLAPGSIVLMTWGDKIDHNYVMIAEPGSVELSDRGPGTARRISVKDPNKVVVVDPWMPIPVAHTLDRCNDEIQTKENTKSEELPNGLNPRWLMAVVIGEDGTPKVLDKPTDGTKPEVLTPLPSYGDVSMLDNLKGLQETFRPQIKQRALLSNVVPLDKEQRLAKGSGVAVRDGTGKAGMYDHTHMSTTTPGDDYQVVDGGKNVGDPVQLLVSQDGYIKSEIPHIGTGLDVPVKTIARDNLAKMPQDLQGQVQQALA
jgi:hypothetical protein